MERTLSLNCASLVALGRWDQWTGQEASGWGRGWQLVTLCCSRASPEVTLSPPMTLVRVVTGDSEVRCQVQGFRVTASLVTTQVLTPSRCWVLDGRVMGAPCRPPGKEW